MTDEDFIREQAARKGRDGKVEGIARGRLHGIARRRPDLHGAIAELLDTTPGRLPQGEGIVVSGGALDNLREDLR